MTETVRMSRTRIFGAVVTCALLASGCAWSGWGAGPGHTGFQYSPGVDPSTVTHFTSSVVAPAATGQVSTQGRLFFTVRDGALVARDASTDGVVWSGALPAGSTTGTVPTVDPGSNTVFVVVAMASKPALVGFDVNGVRNCNTLLDACSPIFRADLGSASGPATPPAVDGGRVFANGAGSLFAFDAAGQTGCVVATGTALCSALWSATTGVSSFGVGPTIAGGVVFDAATGGLGAFDPASGARRWTDLTSNAVTATASATSTFTYVAAGPRIEVFATGGCGSASCNPSFALTKAAGDPAGNFLLASPAVDGDRTFATNENGILSSWPSQGCGSSTCAPAGSVAANAPLGGSVDYSQAPVLTGGMAIVLARRVISGADHMIVTARAQSDLHEITRWDLGTGNFGPGLASVSLANDVIYAPTQSAVYAVQMPAARPLAALSVSPIGLTPAFSTDGLDYTLRCAAGTNNVTVTASAVAGGTVRMVQPTTTAPSASLSKAVALAEDQAAVLEATGPDGRSAQTWIRCLPHDFPTVNATFHPDAGAPTPGWYVTANLGTTTTASFAMILDTRGTPVWYKRQPAGTAALDVKPFGTNRVAYATAPASGYGKDIAGKYDVHDLPTNQVVEHVAANGQPTDFHDMLALQNGNRLVLSYPIRHGVDLTGVNATPPPGANSAMADCEVQEVDPNGALVWKWDASDHVDPVAENQFAGVDVINNENVYDVYHCNSIDAIPGGDVLLSIRHMNAVVRIRHSDGKILWKMGGTVANKDGAQHVTVQNYPQGTPSLQHDARMLPNGDISVFDNQSQGPGPAQGVEFSLDLGTGVATPVFQFGSPATSGATPTATA
jgi:hypothetical protein